MTLDPETGPARPPRSGRACARIEASSKASSILPARSRSSSRAARDGACGRLSAGREPARPPISRHHHRAGADRADDGGACRGDRAPPSLETLDLVGVLAVEMFVTQNGEVLVNELAPRPHNSGHWTIDACVTSQFEQLVRAICGLPLGSIDAPFRCGDEESDRRRRRRTGATRSPTPPPSCTSTARPRYHARPQNGPRHPAHPPPLSTSQRSGRSRRNGFGRCFAKVSTSRRMRPSRATPRVGAR